AALDGQENTPSTALSHQALVRLDYAASPNGVGSLNYLTTVHNKGQTDNIGAEWTEMFADARDKLSVGAALQQGHRLNRQDRRLSARLSWSQRIGELDHHELTTGARVEVDRLKGLKTLKRTGHAFDTDVRGQNVAIYMQERWTAQRNITVNASLQYEHSSVERGLRLRTSSRFEPRLGIAYDPTDEHRSRLFASVSRLHPRYRLTTSEQDQGFADEAVVGAEYELRNYYIVGADYQGRRSSVPQYYLDAATIHVFRDWLPGYQFRASYTYAKTKPTKGTSSQIGSHRFRLDGYRQWDIGPVSELYLGWSLRAADKGYRDANLRIGFKRTISSDHTIDVFTDVASTRLSGPASLFAESSEGARDGSKLQLSVRYSY
ncbi:MAG: TonB-dependent receptor, partial [Kofleriaceae bacterium]|nr:TonB-dependent receptor [Kofleriaceae bacterium]